MRFRAMIMAAAVGGCATQPPMTWQRMGGGPLGPEFDIAVVQCKGEAAQAAAGSPGPAFPSTYAIVAAHNQRQETLDAVMQGCMSKRGYAWVRAA